MLETIVIIAFMLSFTVFTLLSLFRCKLNFYFPRTFWWVATVLLYFGLFKCFLLLTINFSHHIFCLALFPFKKEQIITAPIVFCTCFLELSIIYLLNFHILKYLIRIISISFIHFTIGFFNFLTFLLHSFTHIVVLLHICLLL